MEFTEDIDNCVRVLKNGGLILYPTDTIWGIGCDATNAAAVKKIYELKSRAESKTMIIMVADEWEVLQHAAGVDPEVFLYIDQADKPTTVIYDGPMDVAENLENADGTIAIRIVKDEFCRQLIRRFGKPIVSTSANISGVPAPPVFQAISPAIKEGVDYVVHHRRDDTTPREASAIVRWNSDGSVTVLR